MMRRWSHAPSSQGDLAAFLALSGSMNSHHSNATLWIMGLHPVTIAGLFHGQIRSPSEGHGPTGRVQSGAEVSGDRRAFAP
jgi:hypothetical protein